MKASETVLLELSIDRLYCFAPGNQEDRHAYEPRSSRDPIRLAWRAVGSSGRSASRRCVGNCQSIIAIIPAPTENAKARR